MKITNLKLEYRTKPLGIDERYPTFSWNVETDENNWRQKAYRILISGNEDDLICEKGRVWDTQKVVTKSMVNIPYTGEALQSDTRYYWKVLVWQEGKDKPVSSEIIYFETGLLKETDWHGNWIGETEDHIYHIFRKKFKLEKKVRKADLFVSGLGHYECYINGSQIGDYVLEPGWTNYNKSCLYSSYDITEQLQKEENAIGVILGDGMFNVPGGRYVYYERSYGKCKLLVQLNIAYEDGTTAEITTDETWNMAPSPIQFCCIYGGEDYDGRREQDEFSRADFKEDNSWGKVVLVEPPKGRLVSQKTSPLKIMESYQPIKIEETRPGVYLYDLGKNFSGWVRITLKSKEDNIGTVVTMIPGEILNASKEPDQRVTGRGYHWQYTMNELETQTYAPKFTYTGFRYVQVEGAIPKELASKEETMPILESMVGEFIYSDVDQHGDFSCSNELFNQIHQIIKQAILSNMKSVLTDCPHREKLGWLEESHLIGPSIMYNYDVHNLYEKLERDMEEAQYDKGLVPDICPEYVVFGYHEGYVDSPEWGSACIINPWYVYQRYGDLSVYERYYDVMRKYLDYLTSRTHHHVLHHGLGDWLDIGPCTPYSQNTPVPVIATTIYYYDLVIMHQVANILGKKDDEVYYAELKKAVYEEYNLQFYDNQTFRYATGSQAAQAMSLVVGLVDKDNEQKVLDYLVKDIKARGYATTAGDVGHPFVMSALMMFGRNDVINEMTNVTDKPGYGYQVKCGATTLTEEWDGPQPDHPHGSQNHFMLGSVEEWFFGGLAGLCSIRTGKAFDEIQIKPHFAKNCKHVTAWTMHPYGKVSIHWEKREKEIMVELKIPANVSATFINELDGSQTDLGSGTFVIKLEVSEEEK